MTLLKCAFWNVENLFDPANQVDRGPQSEVELNAKLDRLAECINEFFTDDQGSAAPPALMALAEVNNEDILRRLQSRLSQSFDYVWQSAAYSNQTGLGFLYRNPILAADPTAHQMVGRPRSVLARCHLNAGRSFLFGVNHWKSRMQRGGVNDDQDRKDTAKWLRQEIQDQQESCVVLMGDFNAEPIEEYFNDLHLRGTRHFSKALYRAAQADRLYNTSWRYLTEPRTWEDHHANVVVEQRPKATHSGSFVIWDQLLVSGNALRGLPLRLIESSVRYYHSSLNSEHNNAGVLKPVRWDYNSGNPQGASDHLPILAEFEIL